MECQLCPRRCHIDRRKARGFCGAPDEMLIARIAAHPYEEPCLSGTQGSGTVFFSGCTLQCAYCQNSDISHKPNGRSYTPHALAERLQQLIDAGVHNLNFVTPTHYTPHIIQTLRILKPTVPIVWNTSSYESIETLRMLDGIVDVYLPDLKHYSSKMAALIAHAPDYFEYASRAIVEMCRQTGDACYNEEGLLQKGTLIRHLILPGLTGESMSLLNWIKDTLPPNTLVSLMHQYFPANNVTIKGLDRCISTREYQRVLHHMQCLKLNGFIQEKESASDCFVPLFNAPQSF